MKWKVVDDLEGVAPFVIARIGDWVYLFDLPLGRRIGEWFAPMKYLKQPVKS